MPDIHFTPKFLRLAKKLDPDLQDEVERCLELLQKNPRSTILKTHKLTGSLRGYLSCSVNYQYRIIFKWDNQETITVLTVGDHDVYR